MKTDRFMQGILISDEDELFSYPSNTNNHGLTQVIKKFRNIKKNFVGFKYIIHTNHQHNSQAVFSKTAVEGNIEEAIADVWDRLRDKHHDLEDS